MKQKTLLRTLGGLLVLTAIVFFACQKDVKQGSAAAGSTSDGKTVPTLNAPTLAVAGSSQVSIDITVTAGASGDKTGFSIQWASADALAAYTGPVDKDGWPLDTLAFCKASFSGKAFTSRYNLGPNEAVTVSIGDLLFDNGASTNCPDQLTCGTSYKFRAFCHSDNTVNKSPWSAILTTSTDACNPADCIHSAGYWRNHCDEVIALVDGQGGLLLGTVNYTGQQVCDILHQQSAGNGLVLLAHELIATKLSLANGGVSDACDTGVGVADALIGSKVVPPVGTGSLPANTNGTINGIIAGMRCFNEHGGDHGHCAQ